MNIGSSYALLSTNMFRFICDFEPRYLAVASLIRAWANVKSLTITNVALDYLVMFCFQKTSPPLLPSTEQLIQSSLPRSNENLAGTSNCSYPSLDLIASCRWNCDAIPLQKNDISVYALVHHFFNYVYHFKFERSLVSVYRAKALSPIRVFKGIRYYDDWPRGLRDEPMLVMDPLLYGNNVASLVDESGLNKFKHEIMNSLFKYR